MRYVSGLRFPWLFGLFALVFSFDLVFPDVLSFIDEILLGLGTLLLGVWRKRKREAPLSAHSLVPTGNGSPMS